MKNTNCLISDFSAQSLHTKPLISTFTLRCSYYILFKSNSTSLYFLKNEQKPNQGGAATEKLNCVFCRGKQESGGHINAFSEIFIQGNLSSKENMNHPDCAKYRRTVK